jgi:hypothetical protein
MAQNQYEAPKASINQSDGNRGYKLVRLFGLFGLLIIAALIAFGLIQVWILTAPFPWSSGW